jgi:N-acetylglucosaminyldiphosphoundecaprenol N-acetyl-beta-D-mannosaminyltransferase
MKLIRKKVNILGVPIDSFTKEQSLRFINQKISGKKPIFITTVNVEFLYRALNDNSVLEMLNRSTINFADGIGVLWAAKFLSINLPKDKFWRNIVGFFKLFGSLSAIVLYPKYLRNPIPERISGSDFIWDLSHFAVKNNFKVFLLGGEQTIPEQAALKLQTDVYNLKVTGTFGGSPKAEDETKILEIISKDKPDILFVAYGVPAEEMWLDRNLTKTGAKIGIGVGGTFDFLAGRRRRAPKFLRTIGLEWFWRLLTEPKRYRRQVVLPKLVLKVFKFKLRSLDS